MTLADLHSQDGPPGAARRTLADLPGPRALPLVGNLLQIDSLRFHRQMEEFAAHFGAYYRLQFAGRSLLVLSDHAAIARLLRERPELARRSSRSAAVLEELGARGVFTAEGEDWRMQRKLVMRGLTPEVVRNFFPTLVMLTERMQLRWQQALRCGERVDLLRDLKAYALDVTVCLAMGTDINTLEHPDNPLQRDIEAIFHRVARRVTATVPYWRYFRLGQDRAADASARRIRQAVAGFIAAARSRLEQQPELRTRPSNMLEALLAARDEPASGFTDDHVIGNAVTMVFAGEDTTSNTIAWLLYYLARHPAVAAQLQGESDTTLAGASVLQQFAGLEHFARLDAAVNEAMRLKPVAPFIAMELNTDTEVGDVRVPRGTLVMALLREASRRAADLPDADRFLPERWLEARTATSGDPARTMFPFGGGPRFCPGRYLALAEIKMVVSMLLRNFSLEFDAAAPPVEEVFTFTMTPDSLPVRLHGRAAS